MDGHEDDRVERILADRRDGGVVERRREHATADQCGRDVEGQQFVLGQIRRPSAAGQRGDLLHAQAGLRCDGRVGVQLVGRIEVAPHGQDDDLPGPVGDNAYDVGPGKPTNWSSVQR